MSANGWVGLAEVIEYGAASVLALVAYYLVGVPGAVAVAGTYIAIVLFSIAIQLQ